MANRWHETNGSTWDGNERGRKLNDFLQLTLNGLAVGCIYGLVALGFVLIYKATELVNFAQGDLLMLGRLIGLIAHALDQVIDGSPIRARLRYVGPEPGAN